MASGLVVSTWSRPVVGMPAFWRSVENIIWQTQGIENSWYDFSSEETQLLEAAWNNDVEELSLPNWIDYSFFLPLVSGGDARLQAYGPYLLDRSSGGWCHMRRVLILAADRIGANTASRHPS